MDSSFWYASHSLDMGRSHALLGVIAVRIEQIRHETANPNHMIAFAVKHRNFDGGTGEEILVEFELSQNEYFRELRSLLDGRIGLAADLPSPIREQLAKICDSRLRDRRPHQRCT